jgi:hypothetical protein
MTLLETFSAVKMSASALKTALNLHHQVEIDLKASDLLEKIDGLRMTVFDVYEKNLELVKEKTELEKKVMDNEQWEKEKAKYKLAELETGLFVFAYQKSQENTDPMHYLCKKCMNDNKKSILDFHEMSNGSINYYCQNCNNTLSTRAKRQNTITGYPHNTSRDNWMSS